MTILRMNTLADERLQVFTSLTNHQLRNSLDPSRGIVIVESQIAIRVAVQKGLEPVAFLLDERRVQAMGDVLASVTDDVPTFVLPTELAQQLTGYRVTRGALCAMRRPTPPTAKEVLEHAKNVVVLEGITNTENVGAIFRNAAALGADAVLVAPSCADPLSRRAVRVSMGNVFMVPWARAQAPWPSALMDELHAQGFSCAALALDESAASLRGVGERLGSKRALFFGAEGPGLSAEVLAACDLKVIIPMSNGVDSLNVAASSALAMWELFR